MLTFYKKNLVLFMVLLGTLLTLGCTKPYLIVNTPIPSTAPPADKARVYFIKPGGSMGKAYTFILLEEKVIGYYRVRIRLRFCKRPRLL